MWLNHLSFYHPFNQSYLGILLEDESSTDNEHGTIMEKINLYHQPLQDPLHAIVFFFVRTLIVIFGEFIHIKALSAIKQENGIVNKVATFYIISLMVAGPYYLIFFTSIEFIFPVHKIIGKWYCLLGKFIGSFLFNVAAFHSFVVAIMSYCFIVHQERTIKYGKEKFLNIFLFLSIFIPLSIDIMRELTDGELSPVSSINRCYGVDHKMFLIKTSTLDVAKLPFCDYKVLPEDGPFQILYAMSRYIGCIIALCINVVMGFNLTEAILYYKTFSHIIR